MDFPYKVTGSSIVKPLVSEDKDKYLAMASLTEIGKFIPDVDVEKNVDLLPISFDAFIANRFNKNDDGADGKTSVAIAKLSINKPINIEHKRDKVMGVVLSYAFTDLGTHKQLTEKEASESDEPFYVTLGGVLWRIVNKNIAKKVEEASDPASDNYQTISASWEVGFLDFIVAKIEGESKNLKDATLIKDPDRIKEIEGYMKAFGGKGHIAKEKLYRLVQGDVLPLGFALTLSPAAEVKGVATPKTLLDEEEDEAKAATNAEIKTATQLGDTDVKGVSKEDKQNARMYGICPKCGANSPIATIQQNNKDSMVNCNSCGKSTLAKLWKEFHASEKNDENISQIEKNTVIQERKAIAMSVKITKLEDITDDLLKQASASQITEWVREQMRQADQSYQNEKTKLDSEIKASKENNEKLVKEQAELKANLEKVNKTVSELQQEKEARAKKDAFNTRMAGLDNDFDLSDAEREIIASDIADHDDKAFDAYRKKLDVLLASKKKGKQSMQEQKSNPDSGNLNNGPDKDKKTHNGNGDGKMAKAAKDTKSEDEEGDGDEDDSDEKKVDGKKHKEPDADDKLQKKAKKEAKASADAQEVLDEAVDNSEKKTAIPATSQAKEPTVLEKFSKAFGVDQWISDVKLTD